MKNRRNAVLATFLVVAIAIAAFWIFGGEASPEKLLVSQTSGDKSESLAPPDEKERGTEDVTPAD